MFNKWIGLFRKTLPPSFFIALTVTVVFIVTKLEFNSNLLIVFDFKPSTATSVKMFFDMGEGFSEEKSQINEARNIDKFQELRYQVPKGELKRVRIDPFPNNPGSFAIRKIRVVGLYEKEIHAIPVGAFELTRHMEKLEKVNGHWVGMTTSDAFDPQIMMTNTNRLNKITAYPFRTKIQHILAANTQILLQLFGTILLLSILAFGLRNRSVQE